MIITVGHEMGGKGAEREGMEIHVDMKAEGERGEKKQD